MTKNRDGVFLGHIWQRTRNVVLRDDGLVHSAQRDVGVDAARGEVLVSCRTIFYSTEKAWGFVKYTQRFITCIRCLADR